jgi:voltage-gated potassium channel
MSAELFKHIYFRMPLIIRLLITVFTLMILFGACIHFVEPEAFPTIFDGVWWAVVTGATVGYGDYVPLSVPGRMLGILLILSGGGLITYYITAVSAATVKHEQRLSKGSVAFKGNNHIIFIGWNERTKQLVNLTKKLHPHSEIVLIDHTLDHLSYQKVPVHFIHGIASDDHILKRANIAHASCAVITADILRKEREADNYTILTTVAIRGNNQQIPIIVEMLSGSQIENARRAGADTIIRSNDFMTLLLYHELFHESKSKPFETVLQLLEFQQISHRPLPEALHGQPASELFRYCFQKRQILLGIIREGNWRLNPPRDFTLKENDTVIALSDW